MLLALLWLAGCGADCDDGTCTSAVTVDDGAIDECEGFCATVAVTHGKRGVGGLTLGLESDVDGALFASMMSTDADGTATVCVPGPLTPGTHQITAPCQGCTPTPATIDVAPFGAAYGLQRRTDALTAVPWVPELTGLADDPVLTPDPEGWDAVATMAAAVTWWDDQQIVVYAGQAADTAFQLGVATRTSEDDPFVRDPGSPLPLDEGEGSWNHYGQQAPDLIAVGDELWMYYTAASLEDGGLNIGVATSTDGVTWANHPDNPVLSPTGELGDFDWRGVGHPSILERDGVYELWYASGTLSIGYALSTDGLHFERYCGNPVLEGDPESWDEGEVKAPEVVYDGDMYWMTWSGCDPCFQVGWAASNDGLRWVKHPDPILPAGGAAWSSVATQSAYIEDLGETWRYWYTGNDGTFQSLGVALSSSPP